MLYDREAILSRRYAQAFFNTYGDVLSVADLEQLQKAIRFFQRHHQALSLLKVPLISPEIKQKALHDALVERGKLSPAFEHLIGMLVDDKRSFLIADVLKALSDIYQEQKKISAFMITSSASLNADALGQLQQFLARKTGHTIMYEYKIDANLIAGIRMQSTRLLWEYSIAKQLTELNARSLLTIG